MHRWTYSDWGTAFAKLAGVIANGRTVIDHVDTFSGRDDFLAALSGINHPDSRALIVL